VLDANLRDNLVLGELGAFGRPLDLGAIEREAAARLTSSGANGTLDRTARSLSGGNQQKVVVARALARLRPGARLAPDACAGGRAHAAAEAARVLVAAQPTRGVDLAAASDIHAQLREAASQGAAVLVSSADLDELRALASRILVLVRGRFVASFAPDVSDEEIGRHMLGLGSGHVDVDGDAAAVARPSAGSAAAVAR
jgi:ABC-type uncharacterized transport system ATPase subunit